MNSKKQLLLIEYLISSPDTFALCQSIIVPDYFDPEFRQTVEFIQTYYDNYNTTPDSDQIEAETDVICKVRAITSKDQIQYCATEIETFCKRRGLELAILESPDLIAKGDYGKLESTIRDAIMISITRNLGVRYYESVQDRLDRMLKEDPTSSTGWTRVDELLFGGISRKELLLVSASSGGGKSITLANLAYNFSHNKLNVLYISLELAEDIIAQRFDTMHTGIGRQIWKDNIDEIVTRVTQEEPNCGVIDIVQLPTGSTSNDFRAYLKEYYLHYDMMPDLLIVDYLDEMAPNEKVSADNVWEKDKRCGSQLRQIGVDYNMFVATASQLNRSAVNATEHNHSQIAGGISKINVADVYWSIVMTDQMRAAGEILFIFQKTRNSDGVGNQVYLKWVSKYLRIVDQNDNDTKQLQFKPKEKTDSNSCNNSLLDLMNTL